MKYHNISGILKGTERARQLDIKTFKEWEKMKITTFQCFVKFMKNNGYKYDEYLQDYNTPWHINREDLEPWLNSLGYFRGIKDEEQG